MCSARTLRKFALNVRVLCMRRCWDGFEGAWLPLSRFSFTAHVRLQLPYVWSMEVRVSARRGVQYSRGKECETSSQKVTSARPYAFGRAWGRFKRSCFLLFAFSTFVFVVSNRPTSAWIVRHRPLNIFKK